jgi:hypothetical protein
MARLVARLTAEGVLLKQQSEACIALRGGRGEYLTRRVGRTRDVVHDGAFR